MALFSWLSACLAPARAKTPSFRDLPSFRDYVIAAFRKQPSVASVEAGADGAGEIRLVVAGEKVTGNVTNLFRYIGGNPDEDVDFLVGRFVRSITEDETVAVTDDNIVAVIRSREYVDSMLQGGRIC